MLWYLWTGPLSPLFGKDRMATFESHFVADQGRARGDEGPVLRAHPRRRLLRRRSAPSSARDPARGLIVNGHVPVKIEQGESPVKRSGRAVTIDGAFSEAYGDKGYTLVLEAGRTALAQHHHFESVDEAVARGRRHHPDGAGPGALDPPRRVADTEKGDELLQEIEVLRDPAPRLRGERAPRATLSPAASRRRAAGLCVAPGEMAPAGRPR